MKTGIIGTRGVPNQYGGFEQLAQYLSAGLAEKGHDVTVYNPHNHLFKEKYWNGVHIIHCFNPENKIGSAGQFIYDLNCIRDARKRNFDVLLHLGYTSDSVWHRRWPKKAVNLVNMDGMEWKRNKYGYLARQFLKRAEALAAKHADILIADSPAMQQYLADQYGKQAFYIPYGAEIFEQPDAGQLSLLWLQPRSYYLMIARMEPENNMEMVINGYLKSGAQNFPLVIIGGTSNRYGSYLVKKYSSKHILFPGAIYDPVLLNNLRYYSSIYFHGHSAGGTNPSLLEAMACGCRIAAHRNIFNQFVLGDDANYFSSVEDVTTILVSTTEENSIRQKTESNLQKIRTNYHPQSIIDSYEAVMLGDNLPG
jgi:glycosyltransferase involved in cell wall biosynthesis